ncbi:MAG: hypothetical protein E7043_03035 [Lentisphaerae bacterium]|nr:hypothetical protein [Lentisphaerota bacterium]
MFSTINKWVVAALIASGVLLVSGVILHDYPFMDVATRYAPMAEAFAEGDWDFAFHPRIQSLQVISGGIICFLTGLDGHMAQKTASALWHIIGGFLIFFMLRDIYPKKRFIAWGSTVFYAFFPYSFHVAVSGMRDSAKTTLLILTAWGLIKILQNNRRWNGYWMLGIGCALSVILRADTVMSGIACLFTGMVIECREKKFPLYSVLPAILTASTLIAASAINGFVGGAAMPDYRFAKVFHELSGRMPEITDALLVIGGLLILMLLTAKLAAICVDFFGIAIIIELMIAGTVIISVYSASEVTSLQIAEFLSELFKGFYRFAGVFIFLTILVRLWQNKLTAPEIILILVGLINAVLNILPMQLFHHLYVDSRYLYAGVVLLSGIFIIGIESIYRWLHQYVNHKFCHILLLLSCAAIIVAFSIHAFQPTIRHYTRAINGRASAMQLTEMIRKDYNGPATGQVKLSLSDYKSKKHPKVFFRQVTLVMNSAYLAGGSLADWYRDADYVVSCDGPGKSPVKLKLIGKTDVPGQPEYSLWRVIK